MCVFIFLFLGLAIGCTNILVSKGASADGSTLIAYNADEGALFGSLGHYPAAHHSQHAQRETWDWDSSIYLGQIPEANETYNVVGNINEHGLIIGETTFGGREDLDCHGSGGLIDYGSLIWITLQRAKTAREAIALMDQLTQQYGYASDGESFSIADGKEVWLMELIGKGRHEKGTVWVASRVPDGYICSHANQARTRTFNQKDPDNVLFAHDVVTFAQTIGLYPASASAADFSFSDIYDPVTFTGSRLGEARVWNVYNLATPQGTMDKYLRYAEGFDLTNRMPLFVQPADKLSAEGVMALMRTHGEGTWFDNTGTIRPDVGAGAGYSSYRARPLTWSHTGSNYVNERTVGTQQTAWNFVASSRSWLPAPIAAVMWWAPDDSSTSLRIPVYGGVTRIPAAFGDRVGQDPNAAVAYAVQADAFNMNMDHAFWVWNLVSNMAYGARGKEAYAYIQDALARIQPRLMQEASQAEDAFVALYKTNPTLAVSQITTFTETTGNSALQEWRNTWMSMFSRFRDMYTVTASSEAQCVAGSGQYNGCTSRLDPHTAEGGFSDEWYDRIVKDSDNDQHFKIPSSALSATGPGGLSGAPPLSPLDAHKLRRMNKRRPHD